MTSMPFKVNDTLYMFDIKDNVIKAYYLKDGGDQWRSAYIKEIKHCNEEPFFRIEFIKDTEFKCMECNEIFTKKRSDKEAITEAKKLFGIDTPLAVVCEDCYKKLTYNRL